MYGNDRRYNAQSRQAGDSIQVWPAVDMLGDSPEPCRRGSSFDDCLRGNAFLDVSKSRQGRETETGQSTTGGDCVDDSVICGGVSAVGHCPMYAAHNTQLSSVVYEREARNERKTMD